MRLFNEDCVKTMERMVKEGIKVDLIITDPPYSIKNTKTGGKSKLNSSFQKAMDDIQNNNLVDGYDHEKVLPLLWELQDKKNMYIWCNKAQLGMYIDFFETQRGCSVDLIKWVKTNAVPTFNNKYLSDTEYCIYVRKGGYCNPKDYKDASTLFQAPINQKDKREWGHPTIKPIEIINRFVRNSSNEGDLIFDPFLGSGTTGVAAKKYNRNFIGCELNEEYFNISCKRIGVETPINNVDYTKEEKEVA